jgi:hypothetical protein
VPRTRTAKTAARPRTTYVAAPADDAVASLRKIDHVVVLMLENRLFDHMLGYLSLESGRPDVDGLKASMSNSYKGKAYKVRHLTRTALTKAEDPCHGGACIAEQVANGMGGFVANFAKSRPKAPRVDVVMGYYNGSDLPVYDHLAPEFCVCDRWFASVPGATWPNRLYAVAGRAAGSKDPKKVPIYDVPSSGTSLVFARRRHLALQRRRLSREPLLELRLLRPPEHDRAAQLPRRRARGKAARRLVDRPQLHRRLVRPFTERTSVSNVVYDHTSIIKTILLRFCTNNGRIPDMGARVNHANHLGGTLTLTAARPPTPAQAYRDAVDRLTIWRAEVFRSRVMMEPITEPADPTDLTDLQQQVVAAKRRVRAAGVPEGQP